MPIPTSWWRPTPTSRWARVPIPAIPNCKEQDEEASNKPPFLFTAGAATPETLNALIKSYRAGKAGGDIKNTINAPKDNLGASSMIWRTYAVADSLQTAAFDTSVCIPVLPKALMFTFGGTGPQYWHQGRSLMAAYPVFRDSIYECDRVHLEYTGKSYLEETGLFIQEPPKKAYLEHANTWPGDIVCLANVFFQIAMYDLLLSLNVAPDVVLGFSMGETTALYGCGAIPRDMTIKLAIAIGRAVAQLDNTGGLVVGVMGVPNQTVIDTIRAIPQKEVADNLHISSFISPTVIGVVGPSSDVEFFTRHHLPKGATFTKIHVGSAVHSPYLDVAEMSFRAEVEDIFAAYPGHSLVPQIPMISSVTGEYKTDALTVDYLWDSIRRTILMSPIIHRLIADYGERATFIELSPHPSLSPYIEGMGASASFGPSARPLSARQLATGTKDVSEIQAFLIACGRLFTYGIDLMNLADVNRGWDRVCYDIRNQSLD